MANILYLECYSGISGDMIVSALLDLGADEQVLVEGIESLGLDGYELVIGRRDKNSISAKSFKVVLDDHHYVHNHEHHHNREHEHHHDHVHDHKHHHDHHHDHEHRGLSGINDIIDQSKLSQEVKSLSKKIFYKLGQAEAKAHDIDIEEVHFHEVGAIDSIIDIVGAAICLDNLKIKDVVVSTVYEGQGHQRCAHGLLPVPVPAVANIIKGSKLRLKLTDNDGEMVTPTGAAIVATISTIEDLDFDFKIKGLGIGSGDKDFDHANILRAYLIEKVQNVSEEICLLETNIDDMTGESLGYALEKIMEAGALDTYFTPIYMKKNRPAYKLSVLSPKSKKEEMEDLIFKHTSSLGVRSQNIERTTLNRNYEDKDTSFGKITVKTAYYQGQARKSLEYDQVKALANKNDLALDEIYKKIMDEIE